MTTDKKVVEELKAKKSRSKNNAQQGLNNIQGKLIEARKSVSSTTKAFIIGGGVFDALEEIASGDWGDVGTQAFDALDDFIGGINDARSVLQSRENDPKFLSPSIDISSENIA